MTYKDKIKWILWWFGLRKTIPSAIINAVQINENGEELVDIRHDSQLYFSSELQKRSSVYLRKSVYEKIKAAAQNLPPDHFFKIYSAFRPQEEQFQLWQENYQKIKSQNPTLSEDEIALKTRAVCADPRTGFGGHQTGGAVDLSLCDAQGQDCDMGTTYLENSPKIPTHTKGLTKEQQANRALLKNTMENVGFKNYPHEWWHFCYGDRMWAAYSHKKTCFYGLPNQTNIVQKN